MPIRINYVGFSWDPGFAKGEVLSKFLIEGDEITKDIDETNVLIIGSTLTAKECQIIKSYTKMIILFLSEPITKFASCKMTKALFENKMYNSVIGCISNSFEKTWIKYPIYKYVFSHRENTFNEVNEYVKTCDINNKKFCFLANRHDPGNTRAPIYTELAQFSFIDCPGKLFNNCSNEELNAIGNVEYTKKYLFNICSENYISSSQPGYITEKLMNTCLGGAIPIYFGELDATDEKIFNRDRILFLNDENPHEIAERVKRLMINREELEQFYRQPVFMETAYAEIMEMDVMMMKLFDLIRTIV